ncbi:MAG: eukaryotic-like serine/threonine-protein kinase [Blastocatellia bacterium]|jgi:tetratricopeptide (TPR) repeat protein/predicted Ser/Thr protein kinase|nr:eukaryotic-like serine/threonine-protein kinase [Blastocatellia bacterium]
MIGQTISHYQIVELLGTGGMGVVYAAIDTHLDRRVAIKFLTASSDPQYRARFLREARAVSRLNHPNIATVHDYGETDAGQPFIVMELVTGETLGQLLERSALSLRRAVEIAAAVAEALGEAHRHRIVHRDVKPSNILVTERGQVKVLDFGLVKDLSEDDANGIPSGPREDLGHRTRSDVMVGTPLYLSPEQATSGTVDGRSDLFALGAVLYECITGQSAFSGSSLIEIGAQIIHVTPPVPSSLNARVPAELDRITMKALAKNPEQRYQTAGEIITDLKAAGEQLSDTGPRITRISQPSVTNPSAIMKITEGLRRPRLSLGVLVVVVLAAGAAIWLGPRLWRRAPYKPSGKAEEFYLIGTNALRAGAYQQAVKALGQATEADRNFPLAHARLAEAFLEQDYADQGTKELLLVHQLVPDPSVLPEDEALYLEAINAIGVQDYAKAIAAYLKLVDHNPEQPQYYLDLGRAYEKNEQIDEAIKSYVQATDRDPRYAPAFLRAAILYQRKGDTPTAQQAYDKADSLFQAMNSIEGQTEVLLNRAVLLRETGRFAEARAQLQHAYDLAEANQSELQKINALIELGRVAYTEGKTAQAETYLKQAIDFAQQSRLEPPIVRSLITLGSALSVQERPDEVEKNYKLALDIAQRNKSPYLEALALSSLATHRIQYLRASEGLELAEKALAIFQAGKYRSNITTCLSLIGRARRRKGDYDGALKALEERLSLATGAGNPRQIASTYGDIASVLSEQERYPEALARYQESYALYDSLHDRVNMAYNLMNRSNVLWRAGQYQEAKAALDKAVEMANGPEGKFKGMLAEVELIRAQIDLSRQDFAGARNKAEQVLAASGSQHEGLPIQARYTLGMALSLSGSRAEGQRHCSEAVSLANQADDAAMLSRALIALAESELENGAATDALATAKQAEQRFTSAGQKVSAWGALVIAARASRALHDEGSAQQYFEKAAHLLLELRQNWGEQAYNLYLNRPDVQVLHKQLGGQTVVEQKTPTSQ